MLSNAAVLEIRIMRSLKNFLSDVVEFGFRALEYNKSKFSDEKLLQQSITQTYLLFQMLFCDSIASDIKRWPLYQTTISQTRSVVFLCPIIDPD